MMHGPKHGGERSWRGVLALSAAANLLLWAAFPPLGWSWLAWVAPAFWAYMVRWERLPRGSYWVLWGTSALQWSFLLEGVGRAFWVNYIGLVLLGSYLGIYVTLFVALSRVAVGSWRWPVTLAAPVVWTGLELARGHLLTGFSLGLLGHTQVGWTNVIQVADLFGAYGVSFVVMLVAASLSDFVACRGTRRYWSAASALAVLGAVLVYGQQAATAPNRSSGDAPTRRLTVALLQGTEDTRFDQDFETAYGRSIATFNQYWRLCLDARDERPDVDLIVWPESVFTAGASELIAEGGILPPPDAPIDAAEYRELFQKHVDRFHEKARLAAESINQPLEPGAAADDIYLLVGTDSTHVSGTAERTFNSALLIDPRGSVVDRYYKMHRVMFGEYVPLGDRWPWLYDLMPIGRGLTPGQEPRALEVHGVRLAPSICFESTVPHLIRRQVTELSRKGQAPDVLVNLTNDGWFWGSSILDLHLACAVFRAVELRRPMIVAANTGLSVWIDRDGEIPRSLPRRQEGFIVADLSVPSVAPQSVYQRWGDGGAGVCLALCVVLAAAGLRDCHRRRREKSISGSPTSVSLAC